MSIIRSNTLDFAEAAAFASKVDSMPFNDAQFEGIMKLLQEQVRPGAMFGSCGRRRMQDFTNIANYFDLAMWESFPTMQAAERLRVILDYACDKLGMRTASEPSMAVICVLAVGDSIVNYSLPAMHECYKSIAKDVKEAMLKAPDILNLPFMTQLPLSPRAMNKGWYDRAFGTDKVPVPCTDLLKIKELSRKIPLRGRNKRSKVAIGDATLALANQQPSAQSLQQVQMNMMMMLMNNLQPREIPLTMLAPQHQKAPPLLQGLASALAKAGCARSALVLQDGLAADSGEEAPSPALDGPVMLPVSNKLTANDAISRILTGLDARSGVRSAIRKRPASAAGLADEGADEGADEDADEGADEGADEDMPATPKAKPNAKPKVHAKAVRDRKANAHAQAEPVAANAKAKAKAAAVPVAPPAKAAPEELRSASAAQAKAKAKALALPAKAAPASAAKAKAKANALAVPVASPAKAAPSASAAKAKAKAKAKVVHVPLCAAKANAKAPVYRPVPPDHVRELMRTASVDIRRTLYHEWGCTKCRWAPGCTPSCWTARNVSP